MRYLLICSCPGCNFCNQGNSSVCFSDNRAVQVSQETGDLYAREPGDLHAREPGNLNVCSQEEVVKGQVCDQNWVSQVRSVPSFFNIFLAVFWIIGTWQNQYIHHYFTVFFFNCENGSVKELSFCHKHKFFFPYIFATWWCNSLIFQT